MMQFDNKSWIVLALIAVALSSPAGAYKNYTVGDSLGWYDSTVKSGVDYQKWASGKTFGLGDFLIFNTDTNHSVVQTYNVSTYKQCNYDDSNQNDTAQWSSADPSNTATQPVTVAVPMLKEGPTYFFSGDYDGDQCRSGQRFQINVTHGQGLPKSLATDQAPGPVSQESGDDSAPDTVVPSNFDHPQGNTDTEDDKGDASSADPTSLWSRHHMLTAGCLCLLGFAFHVFMG